MKTNQFLLWKKQLPYYLIFLAAFACKPTVEKAPEENSQTGEFTHRYNMVKERMQGDKYIPVFTREFILADVNINLDNPRRFYNYSGDLSGRYIEAFSTCCHHESGDEVASLVKEALSYQKADGRFGDEKLVFTEEFINKEHTPLLWGNGRMLVGLMEYYKQDQDKEVLEAARRLGDFFKGTYQEVTPKVVKRLEGMGAAGTICFTQWTEPLVLLSQATGDPVYAEVASKIYPTLPPRGVQHAHGFLSTLRGVVLLYEYTGNKDHLKYVLDEYNDLINSDDYTIYGNVKEYFGAKGLRDEGCSTVDFIRLSLQLYTITKEPAYLERAEFAMYNAMYFNQFNTGDFGHHFIDQNEAYSKILNGAWWCCTMSGLRGYQIIQDEYFVQKADDGYKVNLYIESGYNDDNFAMSLERGPVSNDYHSYNLKVDNANGIGSLKLRIPSWAADFKVQLNGMEVDKSTAENYFVVNSELKSGDQIDVMVKYTSSIILSDKTRIPFEKVMEPVKGALCYGPYIMAIDNKLDMTFLAEPSNNQLFLGSIRNIDASANGSGIENSFVSDAYLSVEYKHAGFPSKLPTNMRPVSEMTYNGHPYMKVSHLFLPASFKDSALSDYNSIDPWKD